MNPFKPGDKVICCVEGIYIITNTKLKYPMTVTRVIKDEIWVTVYYGHFKLYIKGLVSKRHKIC